MRLDKQPNVIKIKLDRLDEMRLLRSQMIAFDST
jgi:hypothetical protein